MGQLTRVSRFLSRSQLYRNKLSGPFLLVRVVLSIVRLQQWDTNPISEILDGVDGQGCKRASH